VLHAGANAQVYYGLYKITCWATGAEAKRLGLMREILQHLCQSIEIKCLDDLMLIEYISGSFCVLLDVYGF
jgi:hypothetical protein